MGVEAVKSGNNSITEENTDENEETEDSTGSDDEEIVRDNFSKDKTFLSVSMFGTLKPCWYIYYIFSQCKMTISWKSTYLVVMQFFSLATGWYE